MRDGEAKLTRVEEAGPETNRTQSITPLHFIYVTCPLGPHQVLKRLVSMLCSKDKMDLMAVKPDFRLTDYFSLSCV